MIEGKRNSGYAIVEGENMSVIERGKISSSWSAQACELFALYRALELLKDKVGTIYTDSKYAFGIVHTFGKIWMERGLINTQGKKLIHQELIIRVLEALKRPKRIAVVHVKGHQRGSSYLVRGNNTADQAAKEAACTLRETIQLNTIAEIREELPKSYSIQEEEAIKRLEVKKELGK